MANRYVSQVLSTRYGEHRFGNMIEALRQNFDLKNMAILTVSTHVMRGSCADL